MICPLIELCVLYRRHFIQLLLLILGISIQFPIHAAAATATATITVNIVRPISMMTKSGMQFADISSKESAGTVVLSPRGSRLSTGGASIKSTLASAPAAFEVQGEPNSTYSISLPKSVVMTKLEGKSMVVDKFTSLPAATGLTDSNGKQMLYVGATLNIGSKQEPGPYAGTMIVRINYE